ncbi:MAG: hypothetical protein KIT31_20040, partial [Deltaproteobacteria bacterium]|nr:hypothetical protein [Deltaproteobacteria bacterium]
VISRPRPPSDVNAAVPRPPTPRSPSDNAVPTGARGNMDDFCARRLVDAWRAKDRQALPPKLIPGTKGGFYAGHAHTIVELEYDALSRILIVRRSPINPPYDAPPSRAERERIAAIAEDKAAKLRGTSTEIVELRSRPKKWYVVMRRDFGDPTITDAAFLSAMDDLVKLMVVWRA